MHNYIILYDSNMRICSAHILTHVLGNEKYVLFFNLCDNFVIIHRVYTHCTQYNK